MHDAIQLADASQSSAIAALVNKAYRPEPGEAGWTHESTLVAGDRISAEQVEKLLGPDSLILVNLLDHKIVACVHISHEAQECWIGMLATDPAT